MCAKSDHAKNSEGQIPACEHRRPRLQPEVTVLGSDLSEERVLASLTKSAAKSSLWVNFLLREISLRSGQIDNSQLTGGEQSRGVTCCLHKHSPNPVSLSPSSPLIRSVAVRRTLASLPRAPRIPILPHRCLLGSRFCSKSIPRYRAHLRWPILVS